ncbi:hypothetical protein RD792_011340 [Penstemon davidsonii]|uniref:ADP-ribosylation factor GTPase-activating protein AGD4-like n=1 Tax=Penstemon davidsonii TaxID=160366 RepID=A0ABR0D538_9LAMI|nr:hypothetical protein RD792_011340 [Penstemon davidsonii]
MGFAASLEEFAGGLDDLLGVSIGGPVVSKFVNALHELATYKEFLRSQVEHVLMDRLSQFLSVDLQEAKESRRRFDKAIYTYDQAREKVASLKKTTRDEVVAELEEDLHNSKSAFERSRFNLVNALTNIEAKKKFEFLESFSAIMDAHLRYFKLGYDLLNQMEPFIHQVLTYAQQSKEQAKTEQDKLAKRIQEFRTQSELAELQASNNLESSSNVIGMNRFGMSAHKRMEAIMPSTAKGESPLSRLASLFVICLKAVPFLPRCRRIVDLCYNGNHCLQQPLVAGNLVSAVLGSVTFVKIRHSVFGVVKFFIVLAVVAVNADRQNSLQLRFSSILNRCCKLCRQLLIVVRGVMMVQTIRQGYLLKRSSSLRADWKRRFFVLDSQGTLYYYRNKGVKPGGSPSLHSTQSLEHNNRVFGRFRPRHHRASSFNEESLGCSTVDLRTSTIKIDAEDTDLRLCFRIISPSKTYTLQAENEADRAEWRTKIRGVIESLLSSHLQQDSAKMNNDNNYFPNGTSFSQSLDNNGCTTDDMRGNQADSVFRILREVPGNDQCAECSASEPDWASLNLGILICIDCSGIHRNLGVHISKFPSNSQVRSVTLDVKVWEPSVLDLFRALGNAYCNSVWEELLPLHKDSYQIQYVQKLLVNKEASAARDLSPSTIWEAVKSNNLQEVYRIIIASDMNLVNSIYDEVVGCDLYHDEPGSKQSSHDPEKEQLDPANCERIKSSNDPENCLQGCSILHLACHSGSLVMLELLLQLGADINKCDFHGRTPLLHCILKGNNELAKFLLRR